MINPEEIGLPPEGSNKKVKFDPDSQENTEATDNHAVNMEIKDEPSSAIAHGLNEV
jgi:hypothetical protein